MIKTQIQIKNKKRYLKNREKRAAYQKIHRTLIEVKNKHTVNGKKYRKNPTKNIAIKMKENHRLRRVTDSNYMENKRKRQSVRHRNLEFKPINNHFHNSDAHHINRIQVIYIPTILHESHKHNLNNLETMIEINRIAFEYLTNDIKQL